LLPNRRRRAFAAGWVLVFAANALIAPALCQQFRQELAGAAPPARGEAVSAQATHGEPHSAHHAMAGMADAATPHEAPQAPDGHRTHHGEQGHGEHVQDASCEFCVLTTIASTARSLSLASPMRTAVAEPPPVVARGHASPVRLPLIRGPPLPS
jgi:hypothetical protein